MGAAVDGDDSMCKRVCLVLNFLIPRTWGRKKRRDDEGEEKKHEHERIRWPSPGGARGLLKKACQLSPSLTLMLVSSSFPFLVKVRLFIFVPSFAASHKVRTTFRCLQIFHRLQSACSEKTSSPIMFPCIPPTSSPMKGAAEPQLPNPEEPSQLLSIMIYLVGRKRKKYKKI